MNTQTIPPFASPPLRDWMSYDDSPQNFNARLVRDTAIPTETCFQTDITQSSSYLSHTRQSSEIVHVHSICDLESMASDNIPALTRGNSVASSTSIPSIETASAIDGGFVLESEDGVLMVPARRRRNGDLVCPFDILECSQTFSDIVEFKIHVFSHFRGHALPTYAPCFLCSKLFVQRPGDDNALAWNDLLNHMTYDHYRGSEGRMRPVPPLAVMRHMWNRGIITDAQFTRYQLQPVPDTHVAVANDTNTTPENVPEAPMAPSAPMPSEIRQHLDQSVGFRDQPYTSTAGRRQDRRQYDRLRARVMRVSSNL